MMIKKILTSLLLITLITSLSYANIREVKVNGNIPITGSDTSIIDAFGRIRVSNPLTLFDSKNIMDDDDIANSAEQQPLLYDNQETSGSGTSTTYDPDTAEQILSVGATTAGTRVRQSKQRFNYQPGKSLMIIMSFKFNSQTSGITQREGYFDSRNGLFLEDNGSSYRFIRRTYTSGAAVDNAIAQSSWNIDTMDGTGESGINLDFTKTQLLFIDIEWLGVGRVRMGFVIDGLIYYAHEFLNTNNLSTVYMSSPNLPLRSEISNDGTAAAANLTQICSTVISEGGQDNVGIVRSASTAGTHADVATENAIVPIIGIRLKPEAVTAGITVDLVSAYAQIQTASDQCEFFFLINPTVTGTFTFSDIAYSPVQIATWGAAHTIASGGYQVGPIGYIDSGSNASGGAGTGAANLSGLLKLGSTIAGVADELVLCARPIAGSSDVDIEAGLSWREF